jgi:hypothetical protein
MPTSWWRVLLNLACVSFDFHLSRGRQSKFISVRKMLSDDGAVSEPIGMTEQQSPGHTLNKIRVFVVRHGEREDEVCSRMAYSKMSHEQRLDPALTAQGHSQAMQAFTNIIGSLCGPISPQEPHQRRKVAVFSSPLRRAIGTALMVAQIQSQAELSSSSSSNYSLDWTLPVPQNRQQQGNNLTITATLTSPSGTGETIAPSTVLPIVVLNGLCDCTAQMNHIGGHQNAIRAGFLKCAALSTNNDTDISSPIMSEVHRMAPLVTALLPSNKGQSPARRAFPVQFMRLNDCQGPSDSSQELFAPMTPPIWLPMDSSTSCTSSVPLEQGTAIHGDSASVTVLRKCDSLSTIEQAVLWSIDAGCDTCIVVSHREEIRDLYKKKCEHDKPQHRLSIPYCGIGRFVVSVQDLLSSLASPDTTPTLNWTFHGLTSPEEMTPALVPFLPCGPAKHLPFDVVLVYLSSASG